MSRFDIPRELLDRRATIYVRQSTMAQVQQCLESQRRQYELVELARQCGFKRVEVIDDDLGLSGSGAVERPGFERMVAALCSGEIGAVFCTEASRLARNGRDWHHLLELCGLVGARVVDSDGAYDPRLPADRLMLGMKGSISEFELGVLRSRMNEALWAKAERGELRLPVPIGFIWERGEQTRLDPDERLQSVLRTIFNQFKKLGSARQVFLWMKAEGLHFPRPSDGKRMISFTWRPVRYRNVISVLKNPFYAGAYAYGKSTHQVEIIEGRPRKHYGRALPRAQWRVLIPGHHPGYIGWEDYERNQEQLARNAYGNKGGASKSGRGGKALLSGLLRCQRCGHRLSVAYSGKTLAPKYRCDHKREAYGASWCIGFAAFSVDRVVAKEVLRAVQPLAVEAALKAVELAQEQHEEAQRLRRLELEQARYETRVAERRYAACDPDNRLVAASLESSWEACMRRVGELEASLQGERAKPNPLPPLDELLGLAEELEVAWMSPDTTMKVRQRIVRTVLEEIIVDVDEAAQEVVLTLHWKGGHHSQVRAHKPRTGEHRRRAPEEAIELVRSMAGRWSDEHIAATLNRMGLRTGQQNTWNEIRVRSLRHTHKIHAYKSIVGDEWVTMSGAARRLQVSHHQIRRLIQEGLLAAEQVVPGAPYQIKVTDLERPLITRTLASRGRGPRRKGLDNQTLRIPGT